MKTEIELNNHFSRLAAEIRGEVHTDLLRRYMLSTDGSIFRKTPAAVVYPKSTDDVQAVMRPAMCIRQIGGQQANVHPSPLHIKAGL